MKLNWLDSLPSRTTGVTWGVPWEKGKLDRNDDVTLKDSQGNIIDLQTWPMAYWPDGSVKWTGHATVIEEDLVSEQYQLQVGEIKQTDTREILTLETEQSIQIDTGKLTCFIQKKGNIFIDQLIVDDRKIGSNGKVVVIKEQQEEKDGLKTISQEKLEGILTSVEVEQSGPIRTVVKVEGTHIDQNNNELFPFVIRLYFYRDSSEIRMVHTFIYDGDANKDFIKGIGIEFKGHLTGEAWNRTIQVAGDQGMYAEPGQLLLTRRYANAEGLYDKQISGELIDLSDQKELKRHVSDNAKWNDFKISQLSHTHYQMVKRTEEGCSWINSIHGNRAKGLLYAGGTNAGLAVGIKNFWQKFPTTLEVNNLTRSEATFHMWIWSPDSEAMDFRHYSKDTHVLSAYEGFDEMRATPEGIANTSELYINCFSTRPSSEELYALANEWQEDPLLICEPEYYYQSKALGVWSLPNTENHFLKNLEQQLDHAFKFYKNEVDQRNWYGYWDYGDVMHTYDPVRHQWRYDLGGFAWQNTELVPNIWLWYSFLRTGRADIFKMAEAMTRHTSEVDRYHLGEYAGLGTRHNVMHWGCGCKEVRVSMAGLHKFYYYLTADERTGDLLTSVRDADYATASLDPMRAYFPKNEYPTHARTGPDWSAFASNWLSEWERTENREYLNKILKGINTLKELPMRLLSGPSFGYDPETSQLHHIGDGTGGYHMVIAFGAPQLWMELAQLLDDPEWEDMIAEFGEFYALSNEEKLQKSNHMLNERMFHWPMFSAALVAYAAHKKEDKELAMKAWKLLLDSDLSHTPLPIIESKIKTWKEISEIPWITTNTISQWCLNLIICIELIGHLHPEVSLQESVK